MRILYHFRTRGTGAEGVHIAGIAGALARLGHDVEIVGPGRVDPRRTAGADPFAGRGLARLPGVAFEALELAYNLVAGLRLAPRLTPSRCDLVYERHAYFLGITAWLASRRGVPLVVEVNELVGRDRVRAEPRLAALVRRIDRYVFTRAAAIVVVSPDLKRRITALGVDPARILTLPNAVAPELVRPEAELSPAPRGARVVVGFVGWLVDWHRLDRLLEALHAARARVPGLVLRLVGEGPRRRALADAADRLGLADAVEFVGAVPHDRVPSAVDAMDICVVPHSNVYRSPIKLFEYMARGRAVLAPDTEPIRDVLRDGDNGRLFPVGSVASLADGIVALAVDPDLRRRLGLRALRDVRERHTWDHNARAVLDRLAGRRPH